MSWSNKRTTPWKPTTAGWRSTNSRAAHNPTTSTAELKRCPRSINATAPIGFLVGLGLGSLLGQRTIGVILMIILEVVLTPIVIRTRIPHLENLQRAVIGAATAHLEPGQLPLAFGGGGHDYRLTESTTTTVIVILAWLIRWTAIGAWRMTTRDAELLQYRPAVL